jgi:hypothetical protein
VFAGITDTCGMAMVIAKMPWNQARRSAGSCCSSALLLAVVLSGIAGTALAEYTKDSLDTVKKAVAAKQAVIVLPKDKIIYCHCLAGGRCLQAAILEPLGYDVRPLAPGYPQLVQAGVPTAVGR